MPVGKIPLGESFRNKVSSFSAKLPFNNRDSQRSDRQSSFIDPYSSNFSSQESPNPDILDLDMDMFREAIIEGDDGGKLSEYVNSKLIYEAGVDREGQLMLIFSACNLPDSRTTDYDRLLNLIMFRLDDFVENDYTLIFFAAETQNKPNIKWLFRAYRRLTRKYKKNLKTLYVVHPANWVRILFTAFGSILSPKFNKKLTWVKTLSELAAEVPLDQINIPDQVYSHNYKLEAQITYPDFMQERRFFGVPLEILMGENGERGVPPVVLDAMDYMFSYGLQVPDLFRRNSPKPTVRKIIAEYESLGRNSVAYAVYGEYAASSVLKAWVSELPQPLLSIQLYDLVKAIPAGENELEAAIYIRDVVLPAMSDPPCVAILLSVLVKLFNAVAENSEANNMSPAKIAIAWAPTWVKSSQPELDVEMVSVTRFNVATASPDVEGNTQQQTSNVITLIRLMIQFYDMIFLPTMETYQEQILRNFETNQINPIDPSANKSTAPPPPMPKRRTENNVAILQLEIDTNENPTRGDKSTDPIRQGSAFSDTSSDLLNDNSRDIISNHQITSADIMERLKLEDTQSSSEPPRDK